MRSWFQKARAIGQETTVDHIVAPLKDILRSLEEHADNHARLIEHHDERVKVSQAQHHTANAIAGKIRALITE